MKYLFIVFSALLFIHAGAQTSKLYTRDSASISNAKKNVVELAAVDTIANASPAPFSSFTVRDVRFDTTYIGIKIKTVNFSQHKIYEKTVLQKGTSASLMDYLNNRIGRRFTPTDCTLAGFIKELRITQVDSFDRVANSMKEQYHRLSFEAEAYLVKNNSYYPAARLDTVAVFAIIYRDKLPVLTDVLNLLAVKCAGIDTGKF